MMILYRFPLLCRCQYVDLVNTVLFLCLWLSAVMLRLHTAAWGIFHLKGLYAFVMSCRSVMSMFDAH